ncbi:MULTISPECIES: hypothetical protein [unclassified Leclercia]|uniref:hypothetical protein n=1 Tax=unclassified Leclercia TaxID=2627398 RepID=UPI000CDDA4D1|nr:MULTISPECIES: hypothetical protein [unclassified Leclercia]AXF65430.1 hypothetical protein DVA44_15645 [Leclercia sp. W17]
MRHQKIDKHFHFFAVPAGEVCREYVAGDTMRTVTWAALSLRQIMAVKHEAGFILNPAQGIGNNT